MGYVILADFNDFLLHAFKFDWYACGVPKSVSEVMSVLSRSYLASEWRSCSPRSGYTDAAELVSSGAEVICTAMWGGTSQGADVFLFATGDYAQKFSEVVRGAFPVHRLVRADVAIDYNELGAWESLYGLGMDISKRFGLKNKYVGPAERESSDCILLPGRTLYVGSRASVSFFRIYEKGKKDNPDYPCWVRLELEFKPKGDSRWAYASATPHQIVAATRAGAEVLRVLLNAFALRPCAAGTVRKLSDYDRTLRAIRKQYGNFFNELLSRHGGSLECSMRELLE